MKFTKLKTLVLALVVMTVGGVYATWTFATTAPSSSSQAYGLTLETVNTATPVGTYSVKVDNGFKFTIPPESSDSYNAALQIPKDKYITIKFTPNKGVEHTISENGVLTQFRFVTSQSNGTEYMANKSGHYATKEQGGEPTDILQESREEPYTIALAQTTTDVPKWTKNEDGTFTYKIPVSTLEENIKLNTFVVDTKSEYDEFSKSVAGSTVTLTVSPVE